MFTEPVYVLHPFGRQLPLRVRVFIDFLVEAIGNYGLGERPAAT